MAETDGAVRRKVGIILGSTRPGRNGEAVAKWTFDSARRRDDIHVELIDLQAQEPPLLDEPIPPSAESYARTHTRAWAEKIGSLDAFVFVTPEHDHSVSGALKNAIDFVDAERNHKVAGFVSYGRAGGVRAVEHLRLVMAELRVATVRAQAVRSLFSDFESMRGFRPDPSRERAPVTMLDQLVAWGRALRALRLGRLP